MSLETPDGQPRPLPDGGHLHHETACFGAGQGEVGSELSAIGTLCQDVLCRVEKSAGVPDGEKMAIGTRINSILVMFREYEESRKVVVRKNTALKGELRRIKEQLAVLRQEHFGASSEKGQAEVDDIDLGFGLDDEEEEPKEKSKGRRPRKEPRGLAPIVVDHYPENRSCSSCGDEMASISSWTGTRFEIVPEHVRIIKDVHHTCACNREHCKDNKPVAAKSRHFIMKGRSLDLSVVIEAAAQKFFEHTPTFRMERRMHNSNLNVSRHTIGRNISHLAGYLEPVRQALFDHVKSGYCAHMDETPVRVQAPGKGKCKTGYFWAMSRDEQNWNAEAKPAVAYHYAPSRAGSVAAELLSGATLRFLHTDGYTGYNRSFSNGQANGARSNTAMFSARCWAHARRKFIEAGQKGKSKFANSVVKMIGKIYAVEKAAKGLSPEDREALRRKHSLPVLDTLYAELTKVQGRAQGGMKTAINYTLNAFDSLRHFIFDGRLEIDNNPVERCIRGIALTRKNSLFAGSDSAAQDWAIYYSLIESARLNKINPRSYLKWVVEEIERSRGDVDHALLLPWHCPVGRIED